MWKTGLRFWALWLLVRCCLCLLCGLEPWTASYTSISFPKGWLVCSVKMQTPLGDAALKFYWKGIRRLFSLAPPGGAGQGEWPYSHSDELTPELKSFENYCYSFQKWFEANSDKPKIFILIVVIIYSLLSLKKSVTTVAIALKLHRR